MSVELKNNTIDWKPSAEIDDLKKRAQIFAQIRKFFSERSVWEVETPLLSNHTVTDVHIDSFQVSISDQDRVFLQTSPEYAMKRLLAAGSGSIYQICKAFRKDECGQQHNPEFTLLEWYRVGFDYKQLMKEIDELLQLVLQCQPAEMISYADIFQKYVACNPHEISKEEAMDVIANHHIDLSSSFELNTKADCLDMLFHYLIEPKLSQNRPTIVYDYPRDMAALAKLTMSKPQLACRFEVYFGDMELANGFYECDDAVEQRSRFVGDQEKRLSNGRFIPMIDERLIDALHAGLPDCSGVALGLDRLIMCVLKRAHISDVLSFDFSVA